MIIEMRTYKTKPGRRAEFLEIFRSRSIPAHAEIDLPSDKDVWLETGVFDPETGKAGTLEIPLLKK